MTYTLEQMKANRELWATALESGEYEQSEGLLREGGADEKRMCTLGVLADLAGCQWEEGRDIWFCDGRTKVAPQRAMDFVGLSSGLGGFADSSLSDLNDEGVPFSKIATIIRSEPPGLFVGSAE